MSQSREKPKFVAPPPPAHQAIHPIKFTHSVPEYTAKRRNKRAWKKGKGNKYFLSKNGRNPYASCSEETEDTYSSRGCRLCVPAAGGAQGFPLQCSGKNMALFSQTWAGVESYWPALKQEARLHHKSTAIVIVFIWIYLNTVQGGRERKWGIVELYFK